MEGLQNAFHPDGSLIVERYVTNGVAKSSVTYTGSQDLSETAESYIVTLKPLNKRLRQDGLVMPYPIPDFSEQDLIGHLRSSLFHYKMEIDSSYNSDSTHANFIRLLRTKSFGKGERDPVTGKIYKSKFILPYNGADVTFLLETYPYRDGSKAVMYLTIPATFTSPGVVDLGRIIEDLRKELEKIVKA